MADSAERRRSSSKSEKALSGKEKAGKHSTSKQSRESADEMPECVAYLGGKHRALRRRTRHEERFDQLSTAMTALSSSSATRPKGEQVIEDTAATVVDGTTATGPSPSASTLTRLPVLSVAYMARAMGLNVSSAEVTAVIALIEDEGPSAGSVSAAALRTVLVDALMTGTVGGPTLRQYLAGMQTPTPISGARLDRFTSFRCVRDDEATIFRAFEAIDDEHKGYLEFHELRDAMMLGGEHFTAEEMEEMWMSMRDPVEERVYYREFADILASE